MKSFQFLSAVAVLFFASNVAAQCDPMAVDFGAETWGLSPDAEVTFAASATTAANSSLSLTLAELKPDESSELLTACFLAA